VSVPKTVEVNTLDGEMALYDAEPDGAPRGAVVVIQEAFGVNSHIEDVTRRFASAGYRSVAPHLFHRTGDPPLDYSDISKVMPHMQAITADGLVADLEATFGYLATAGFGLDKTGIVGFCMGGTVAFLAATRFELAAAVTFYGGGVAEGRFGFAPLLQLGADLKAPWLGLYGDADQGIPVEQVESLREAVGKAPVRAEIVRYADAEHGFHCDMRDSYHEASATDAWGRTLAWFESYLKGA
jgi:carboxymethylenebutenolidase